MDELDQFWSTHFNRTAAPIERRMIAAFDRTVGAEDPMFPVLMMQVCNLYETLGSVEKAVLSHGPALELQMADLGRRINQLNRDVTAATANLVAVSAVSKALLSTQQQLLAQRNLEFRIATLPEWVRAILVAVTTAIVMMLGAGLFTLLRIGTGG